MTNYPAYPPQAYPPPHARPVPMSPGGQPLADFGSRLLAYIIDAAIVGGISMIIFTPVLFLVMFTGIDPASDDPFAFLIPLMLVTAGLLLLQWVAYYFYYVGMLARTGQTIGKRIAKVKVVPIDPRATLTRGMAGKRYLVHIVAGGLIAGFGYVDGFWQLWDKPYQQTLHDKFAQTVVVKIAP